MEGKTECGGTNRGPGIRKNSRERRSVVVIFRWGGRECTRV